jgi:ribose transport system substrate-binding protein
MSQFFRFIGRIILLIIITLFVIPVLAACGQSAGSSSLTLLESDAQVSGDAEADQDQVEIALVMKTLTNPFFIEMERGARRAAAELDVALRVRTAAQETSIDQQIAIVEELITAQVDAIVIAPGDSTSLIPVLRQAQAAGIVIVNIDNRLDPDFAAELELEGVPFISVDNEAGAYDAVRVLVDQIDTPTDVAILQGIPTAQNAIDREAGARQAFGENPNITIVASTSAHWKIDEGYDVTAQLLEAHPQIGALFCANDMMALGAIRYLSEIDRNDVLVAGFDNLQEVQPALAAGTLQATIDQQAAEQGYLGVQYAYRLLQGEVMPVETMIPTLLITSDS